MHSGDVGMAERGDMFANRKKFNIILKILIPIFSGFGKSERFTPDLLVEDGDDFSEYGIDARVLSIPGHSSGSIGILTSSGDLFCGDLLINTDRPGLSALTDDLAAANASLQNLESLEINTVYPGHGKPFPMHMISKETT